MPKPLALLIHSLDSSLPSVSKLLEARDFSVHVSRSLEEAERVFSAFPADQFKYVFADVTLCDGSTWNKLMERARGNTTELALVCYHPQHTQHLYGLLGHAPGSAEENKAASTIKVPLMIGDTPQFHDCLNLANRYAMHDITVLSPARRERAKKSWLNISMPKGPERASLSSVVI